MSDTSVTATALRLLRRYPWLFALILSLVMLAISLIAQPNFGPAQQLAAFAPLALAAVASMPSIVSGGIDVSISPTMTLIAVLFAGLMVPLGLGGPEGVLIMLALGALIGAANGLLIVVFRLPAIVVTLAVVFVLGGATLRLTTNPVYISDSWIVVLAGTIGAIPGALISLVVPILIWAVLMRTPFGRQLYAVGGNDATAFSAGVQVGTVRIIAYSLGGLFAAMAGIALLALTRVAIPGDGLLYLLPALAAVAVGGVALTGGRGGITAAVVGSSTVFLLQSALTALSVPQVWLSVSFGLLLLVAVMLGAILNPRTVAI